MNSQIPSLVPATIFRRLLSEYSHELRGYVGSVQMLLQLQVIPDQVHAIRAGCELAKVYGDEMLESFDNLCDLGRIALQPGERQISEASTDLCDPLIEAIVHARTAADPRDIGISYETWNRPLEVAIDHRRLARIFHGVLRRLVDVSADGDQIDVTISAESNRVRIRFATGYTESILRATDFEVYDASDNSTAQVGLIRRSAVLVAQWIAEMYGGRLDVHADAGSDSAYLMIELPLAESPSTTPTMKPAEVPRQGLQILVVDDRLDSVRALAMYLKLLGHSVATCQDGEAALEEADKKHFDVIILDVGLPKLDGIQVAARLREDSRFNQTKLIALSGYDLDGSGKERFDHHLVKPVDHELLERCLRS